VLGSICLRCSPSFRRERALTVGAFLLSLVIVFAIARYTAPREPLHFIGTPVESSARNLSSASEPASVPRAENAPSSHDERPIAPNSPPVRGSLCNAPTKSGRPCQRRMKAGGYCWQHRDKFRAHGPAINGR
jgi:hypothetical protein